MRMRRRGVARAEGGGEAGEVKRGECREVAGGEQRCTARYWRLGPSSARRVRQSACSGFSDLAPLLPAESRSPLTLPIPPVLLTLHPPSASSFCSTHPRRRRRRGRQRRRQPTLLVVPVDRHAMSRAIVLARELFRTLGAVDCARSGQRRGGARSAYAIAEKVGGRGSNAQSRTPM